MRQQCRRRVEALAPPISAPDWPLFCGREPGLADLCPQQDRACEEVGIRPMRFAFPIWCRLTWSSTRSGRSMTTRPSMAFGPAAAAAGADLTQVLGTISVDKDVDGFHLYNVVGWCRQHRVRLHTLRVVKLPSTSASGSRARTSSCGGEQQCRQADGPHADATGCHGLHLSRQFRDLAQFTILADILVVAAGHPKLISAPMVRTGAVVIDVGSIACPTANCGDVDFEGVLKSFLHHAGSGRRRSDDGHHAAREHDKLRRTRCKSAMTCLQARVRGHRLETPGAPASIRTGQGLAQGQESGGAGRAAVLGSEPSMPDDRLEVAAR